MARAVGLYDKACMDVIHALKYKGRERLARPLSLLLLAALHRFWPVESIDLVVPVPLHIRKLRQRGFNQSFLLVKPWPAIAEEMPAGTPSPPVDDHILCRQRWTEPQTGLRRRDRMINIRDAFGVRYPQRVRGKKVLLVDDVFTTGSTVEECARVLLKAGASRVDVLTLARAA